jgi:N-acetylneuraminic acid mutarotase
LILAPVPSQGKSYKWKTEFSTRLIAFDPSDLTFQELEAMPSPMLCKGTFVNEFLYVFGAGSTETLQSNVLRYDTHGNNWENLGHVPVDINSSAIASSGQQIFLLGTRGFKGYLGIYDTNTQGYIEFPTNVKDQHGVACVRDNKLYYFGGIDINFPNWIDRKMYVLDLTTLLK